MIMVVVMFLACNTLALVVNVVETFFPPSKLILNYMTDTSNFLVIFNSSANFIVYVCFSKDFRRLFLKRPCVCLPPLGERRKKRGGSLRPNGYAQEEEEMMETMETLCDEVPILESAASPSPRQAGRLAVRSYADESWTAANGGARDTWASQRERGVQETESGFDPRGGRGIFV